MFGHLGQVGLWAGFLVRHDALQTYDAAFYFSLVVFATPGYDDIVLAPGLCILGALRAACGSLMLGWSTALIFAAVSVGGAKAGERRNAQLGQYAATPPLGQTRDDGVLHRDDCSGPSASSLVLLIE